MAVQDFTKLLGKRVTFDLDWSLVYPSLGEVQTVNGVIVAYLKYAKDYEPSNGITDVLFLEDGHDEPDFISSDHEFKLLPP